MKKIFSILAVGLFAVAANATPAYNTPAATWTVGDEDNIAVAWSSKSVKEHPYSKEGNWFAFSPYAIYQAKQANLPWTDFTSAGSGGGTTTIPAYDVFSGCAYYVTDNKYATANLSSTPRVYSYSVKNLQKVGIYGNGAADGRNLVLEVLDGTTLAGTNKIAGKGDNIAFVGKLDPKKTYTVVVYGDNTSNSNFYEIAFCSDTTGGAPTPKASAPTASKASGTYFDEVAIVLSSKSADKIYYSLNDAAYVEYTDTIVLNEVGEYYLSAYSVLGELKSDTVLYEYVVETFVPRIVFGARAIYMMGGATAEDIQIANPATATLGTYTMDGKACPSVSYKYTTDNEGQAVPMNVTFKAVPSVTLSYSTTTDKANVIKEGANYAQLDQKGFTIKIDNVQGGDTIVFVATAKGGTAPLFANAEGMAPYQPEDDYEDPLWNTEEVYTASDARTDKNYCGYSNLVYIVEKGKTSVSVKETAGGVRLAKILVGADRALAPTGIKANKNTVKAVKTVKNGQLVIVRGDKQFNVLGAEL